MKRTPLERRTPLRAKRRNYGGVRRALESKPHGDPKLAALGARTVNFPSEAEMILATRRKLERRKSKHARRERAPEAWWIFVKTRTCFVQVMLRHYAADFPSVAENATPCSGPIEADHMGDRFRDGDGTRARDYTCVGLCNGHHGERTNVRVARTFKGFAKDDMRALCARGIAWTHEQARALGVEIPDC